MSHNTQVKAKEEDLTKPSLINRRHYRANRYSEHTTESGWVVREVWIGEVRYTSRRRVGVNYYKYHMHDFIRGEDYE